MTIFLTFQFAEVAAKGKSLCKKMGKPCEADAQILGSLFPTSSAPKRTLLKAFNPLDGCVVSKQKQQKKATRIKPRKVTVVLIPDPEWKKAPRGLKRKDLHKDGFIQQLEFLRNMSSQQVKNTLIRGFSDKAVGKVTVSYLTADPNLHVLTKVEEREGGADGADIIQLAGQGSLYVRFTVSVTSTFCENRGHLLPLTQEHLNKERAVL